MSARLRVGVFGAGPMGANHLRALGRRSGDIEIAGVADPDTTRAAMLTETLGVPAVPPDALARGIDAAIVATSSSRHLEVGLGLLEAGIPCLIEKPLALTEAECIALIDAADRHGVVLAVGHIERYNPAVVAARALLAGRKISTIDALRLNAGSARVTDTDVVIDLMIHDVDIVLDLMGMPPSDVVARGVTLGATGALDHATALLSFPGGLVASVGASRMTPMPLRELRLLTDLGLVVIDCLGRRLKLRGLAPDADLKELPVTARDALEAEHDRFLRAVRGESADVGVSGRAALETLRVVWAIQRDAGIG